MMTSTTQTGNETSQEVNQDSRRKKLIRWASKSKLRITERSDSQRCLSSWYTDKDYNEFKQDCRDTIAMAGNDDTECSESSEFLCLRGLEVLGASEERAILRLERRQQAQDAVWDAQDSGEMSGEIIAEAVRRVSESSQMDAHLQALQYSGENKREELMSSISGLIGRRTKSAFRGVGGSMRNLGKKKLSMRNLLGKKDSSRNLLGKKDSMRHLLGKKDSMRKLLGKKDSMRNLNGKKDSMRNLLEKMDSMRNLRDNSPTRKQTTSKAA